jgi:hypothetical protein
MVRNKSILNISGAAEVNGAVSCNTFRAVRALCFADSPLFAGADRSRSVFRRRFLTMPPRARRCPAFIVKYCTRRAHYTRSI